MRCGLDPATQDIDQWRQQAWIKELLRIAEGAPGNPRHVEFATDLEVFQDILDPSQALERRAENRDQMGDQNLIEKKRAVPVSAARPQRAERLIQTPQYARADHMIFAAGHHLGDPLVLSPASLHARSRSDAAQERNPNTTLTHRG